MPLIHLSHCHPKTGAKADPSPSSSSDFLTRLPHRPFTAAHSFVSRAAGIAIHLI